MMLKCNVPPSIQNARWSQLPGMASIEGLNFLSHFCFEMVSFKCRRAKFITSSKPFLIQHDMTGIDIDWEFLRSAPRDNT